MCSEGQWLFAHCAQDDLETNERSLESLRQADGRPRFTGADTGIIWGSQGVWEEPWTHASAIKTLQMLDANWNRLKSPRRMHTQATIMDSEAGFLSATQVGLPSCLHYPLCLLALAPKDKYKTSFQIETLCEYHQVEPDILHTASH